MVPLDREEFSQARHTLDSARRDTAYGHALSRLLEGLKGVGLEAPGDLPEAAKELDLHYIPARYPDAYPEGSPHLYYTAKRASEALEVAEAILAWVEGFYAL
jgi:HEPN domain-containing protein